MPRALVSDLDVVVAGGEATSEDCFNGDGLDGGFEPNGEGENADTEATHRRTNAVSFIMFALLWFFQERERDCDEPTCSNEIFPVWGWIAYSADSSRRRSKVDDDWKGVEFKLGSKYVILVPLIFYSN